MTNFLELGNVADVWIPTHFRDGKIETHENGFLELWVTGPERALKDSPPEFRNP